MAWHGMAIGQGHVMPAYAAPKLGRRSPDTTLSNEDLKRVIMAALHWDADERTADRGEAPSRAVGGSRRACHGRR